VPARVVDQAVDAAVAFHDRVDQPADVFLPRHVASDERLERRRAKFAGFVLFYLGRNHCFTDGSKRVAWLAAMWILEARGVTVQATTDEAEAMILAAIEGTTITSGVDVARWFADRLVASA
jgi:hypothetical protein